MQILNLFTKTASGKPPTPCDRLWLRRGLGIEGDAHARAGSPRQVLLGSAPVLMEHGLRPGDLRENILLDSLVEALVSGQVLQLGNAAQVRIMGECEPCAYLNTLQPGLAKRINGRRGVLAMVISDGMVQVGDRAIVLPQTFPAIPNDTRGKLHEFVARIPLGRVVRTTELLVALGLTASHYRAIPVMLKKAEAGLPVHRVVGAGGRLLTQHLPNQAERLTAEGVPIEEAAVPSVYSWEPAQFHALDV
ncbi:MOSC domain-containing protein [Leptolyngbya sp. O-77]|uniref:MOSC domain-containing protein n=1 Tax=Leptolyngbya sp. O-77 TaxID=1080068 RepID=UPI00074D3C12|nr:MOSC domain-containing protein [Leptolyngbya sp. O-77]BAU41052.1 6-O-methylguanine DNA methyltransferase, DNA binding domain [Leptolyngbya sp. O-77]